MKVKMKQNKNSSAIRISSFVLAFIVLCISISVPVFAYTDTSLNGVDFEDQPIPVICNLTLTESSAAIMRSNGLVIAENGSYKWYVACKDSSHDMYAFSVGSVFYFYSLERNASSVFYMGPYDGRPYNSLSAPDTTINGVTYAGFSYNGTNASLYGVVPSFSSISDGISAALDWVNNPPVVSTPHSLNTSLPAGNAIIIDVSGNNAEALSLSTSSALRHKDNWSDGNQMMGYFSSAPTSLSSPFDGTHSITWRGVGSPNLFGGYNTWNTTAPLLPTGNFLVIVNPAYPNDNPDSITSNQASNGAITISCGYCLSAQIVPLSSSWSNGSIVSTSGDLRLNGEYDPTTESWTFNNSVTGQPQNPVAGGLTDVDAEHITINDWLQNISHQIASFFSGAIGAVSTLVSAGSDFIHSLSSLYAWLPAPVFSVLSAALILVITIGVIKVFI